MNMSKVFFPFPIMLQFAEGQGGGVPPIPPAPPIPPDPPADDPMAEFAKFVPDAVKSSDWFKKYTSPDQFFKEHEGLRTQIGKRPAGIPQETASDDEWNKYLDLLAPKEGNYGLEFAEGTPEDFKRVINDLLKEAKVPHRSAKVLASKFDLAVKPFIEASQKEQEAKAQAQEAEFETLMTQLYPDEQKRKSAIADTQMLLKQYGGDAVKNHIDKLDNNSLVLLTGVLSNVRQSFMKEGKLDPNSFSQSTFAYPNDITALYKALNEVIGHKDYDSPLSLNYNRLRQTAREISVKIAELSKK